MKFWVGVTDNKWYERLSLLGPEEVNFWQPSASPPFKTAQVGMPFLFKLKKPFNHIAGGGYFVGYSRLPINLAWEIFEQKNGADSLADLQKMLDPLKSKQSSVNEIGCTILANPFFLPSENWIADPAGWSSNIVRGKMYESESGDGGSIWQSVVRQLTAVPAVTKLESPSALIVQQERDKYGSPVLVRPRLGQSAFRVLVTDAYKRRCAITGENTLVALEAAHIVPYSQSGIHEVKNGLLLRADFHRLFDVGLVGITPDLRIRISPKIRETWFNGKVYYRLNDQPLAVIPDSPDEMPDRDRLEWHLKNCFQS